jgi:phosphonatase-like hydrolase
MTDLVVFDMIGTTVEASPRIPEAFREAYRVAGIELSDADISSIRGKSKRAAIRELLERHGQPAECESPVYETFKAFLLDCYRDGPVNPVAGAESTFRWCGDHDINVALTTGFDRTVADLLVSHLGWSDIIDTLVCNDEVAQGRPAPDLIITAMRRLSHIDVSRVASVGDTVFDLEAGANAGTGVNVGVLSGAHTRAQLLAAPHTALIDSVADLPQLLSGRHD